jgi:uncharacterized protein (DUF1697 family)
MPIYISLLRGINVGGQKSIKMAELKSLYESIGFTDVTTYIQSGNVIFSSRSSNAKSVAAQIVTAIQQSFGFAVTLIIRQPEELAKIIKKSPYSRRRGIDETRLHVTFLDAKPAPASVKALIGLAAKSKDEYQVIGTEIYLHCPNGYGKSLLSNTFFEKHLKVAATTRNWNSVNTLYTMSREIA